ncbi:MAG: MFS transporter [Bryobacteraceae bacterium]
MERTFQSFHFRDFRVMFAGACISQVGTQMQVAAQSWTVLGLSNNNSFYLGIDQSLGVVPIVLFSLLAGVLADRRDRRTLILSSQYTQMTCAFIMALLAFTGILQVWHIWCISFVVGTAQAFGGPSYSALVPTLVPREHLPNAIALNSMQFNLARLIGPTFAGVALTTVGAAWCFGLNSASFLVVIATLYMINVNFVPQRSSGAIMQSMKQGFGFIAERPAMRPLILLSFMVTLLGFQIVAFLPVFAKERFQAGPQAYTTMLSCSGAGAVAGALIVAALGKSKHQGRNSLIALIMLGVLTLGFAFSPNIPVACGMIFLCGIALMAVFNMNTSLVQMIVPDDMRGRVMSVYNLSVRGGQAIGPLIVGSLIPIFTARYVIASAGVLLLCLGLYFFTFNRKVTEL